jgi:hypothetical protein
MRVAALVRVSTALMLMHSRPPLTYSKTGAERRGGPAMSRTLARLSKGSLHRRWLRGRPGDC